MAFPFYYMGYKSKIFIKRCLQNAVYRIFLLVFSVVLILLIMKFNGTVSTWAIGFGSADYPFNIICYYMVGAAGTIMVCCISSFMKKSNAFSLFAANSLISVLGFQVLFIFIIDNVIGFNLSYGKSFFVALAIYILCLLCHAAISRKVPFLIGKK